MNGRIFAALFVVIFLAGALPMLLVQPAGVASAWLTVGFARPIENPIHVLALMIIGLLAARRGRHAMLLLPLSTVLMLAIGAMMRVDAHLFPAISAFVAGAIILFALGASLLRGPILFAIPPVAVWAYFTGSSYMNAADLPADVTPLYYLMGMLISAVLTLAMGVSLGVTLAGGVEYIVSRVQQGMARL